MPPPTTNSPIIMMIMELENPERASAGVNILNNIKRISAHKATRSERILPLMKRITATAKMVNVMSIFLILGAKVQNFGVFPNLFLYLYAKISHNKIMRKLKLYLDTSVISHLQALDTPEKMRETQELWEILKVRPDVEIVISELTLRELNRCQQPKLDFLLEKLNEFDYLLLNISEDDMNLANHYLENTVLTEKSIDDLQHIAIATLNNCRYILSWNFKHFVNPKTINAVWAINKMKNLPEINIVSPSMMLGGF